MNSEGKIIDNFLYISNMLLHSIEFLQFDNNLIVFVDLTLEIIIYWFQLCVKEIKLIVAQCLTKLHNICEVSRLIISGDPIVMIVVSPSLCFQVFHGNA